jgi:glycine dehydrogenase
MRVSCFLYSSFVNRHIGITNRDIPEMLRVIGGGYKSLEQLIDDIVPHEIRDETALKRSNIPIEGLVDDIALVKLREIADENIRARNFLGQGFYGTVMPHVIQRYMMEEPGWFTPYTPYQSEISQGRLEMLLNFQTMINDLTGLKFSNCSLLDEGSAAAEAMSIAYNSTSGDQRTKFFVAHDVHPTTVAVVKNRASPLNYEIVEGDPETFEFDDTFFGALLQYPGTDGFVNPELESIISGIKSHGIVTTVATDLLALCLLRPPGEMGADICIGSSQRFGVPIGFGGPHAAFISVADNKLMRKLPGRIVGISKDRTGKLAYRLTLQTREQHIRREKATSNICTAQALLANISAAYAIYHGPETLKEIARRTHFMAKTLENLLLSDRSTTFKIVHSSYFDTVCVEFENPYAETVVARGHQNEINIRLINEYTISVSFDETHTLEDVGLIYSQITKNQPKELHLASHIGLDNSIVRSSKFLTHPTFNKYQSETEMLRYMYHLQKKDMGLEDSMIPLGSCTMKLNSAAEMIPLSWLNFNRMHPFAPTTQTKGYQQLFNSLEKSLAAITGFDAISLQPNAGATGEYSGLRAIQAYHEHNNQPERKVCLIPRSAHGTNPASAKMAGMEVVIIECLPDGYIDFSDLRKKLEKHANVVSAIMITYPSTFGIFEEDVIKCCEMVHSYGGQVYMDGANMNAQVGLTNPGFIGADVVHLNLHKTFCLSEGTLVSLPNGTCIPIENLVQSNITEILAYSENKKRIIPGKLVNKFNTGGKKCITLTFQDGRTVTCTEDHKILTTLGWVEAGSLLETHKIVVSGIESVHDIDIDELEKHFEVTYGRFVFNMITPSDRERTLAFFRLTGFASADGSLYERKKKGQYKLPVYVGVMYDCQLILNDIELLTGKRPTVYDNSNVFVIQYPAELAEAIASIPGINESGKRTDSKECLPSIILSDTTPISIIREYLGGLFGGDGISPCIVHLDNNPDTMKEVRFLQTRSDKNVVTKIMNQVKFCLRRLGVESYVCKTKTPSKHNKYYNPDVPRYIGRLTVKWGTDFAENVGFRYCSHKSARLGAATAWWRMKQTILEQRRSVARKALHMNNSNSYNGNGSKWKHYVSRAYNEEIIDTPILNKYYTSFDSYDRLSKQHLDVAANGGARKSNKGLRQSNKRANFPAKNKKGNNTGVPELKHFLKSIGALDWFSSHTKGGTWYNITYASKRTDVDEPVLFLNMIGKRSAGIRTVYDLTVEKHHSFLANNIVVHNCIPHGGGGPGVGPIGVRSHLAPFLPTHPYSEIGTKGDGYVGPMTSGIQGSASILPVVWMYLEMMGQSGLRKATKIAILNANYIMTNLKDHYDVNFVSRRGEWCAHEFVIDISPFNKYGIKAEDVCKRLIDFSFHGPTMSWPVNECLMIEPTESESKAELDRFIEAMIHIRAEIEEVVNGTVEYKDSIIYHAPHTVNDLVSDWDRKYSRERGVYPVERLREKKFWPSVNRLDNAWGDRNIFCSCNDLESLDSLNSVTSKQ